MKAFLKNFTTGEKFYLLILAAVSFAVMMPVLIKGVPFGYDLPHHYQCALTFYESILSGDFYPSWSLNRNFGFGGMETRLYPPISHYSLALFYMVTGNWHIASWLTFTFYTFVGCFGVYLWAKEYMPAGQAVFAGCLYALLPYHLNQLYNTFFFAEFVGSSVLPFTFVFVARVCKRGKIADIVGLAISFAILILTHLPLTVIGSICFGIYALTLFERDKIFSQTGKLALGVIGGLAASSFFWIKVLAERDLMAKTLVYPDPWLDYRLHFLLTPIQTFEGELQTRIYETATFFYDLMFLYPIILVLACTIPFFIWERRSKNNMKSVWLILGLSVFLAVPFSRFIWDRLPLLQEVQFPWRWLAIVCIVVPVISASQINFLIQWFKDKKRPAALIIGGCILAVITFSVSQIIRQAPFIEKGEVTEYINNKGKDIGFTFWWTIWTRKEAFDNKEKVLAGNRKTEINTWTVTDREFQVAGGDATEARIALFYHPNWKATVNDLPVETKADKNGALQIALPTNSSSVKVYFQETSAVLYGQWISAIVWLFFLFWAIFQIKRAFLVSINEDSPKNLNSKLSDFIYNFFALAQTKYAWLMLVFFSVLSLLPMILIGIYKGVDLTQHSQFATTFQSAISSGDFYPGWAANENLGYGGLGVRFYPPLTPFVGALFRIFSGDWHTATWLTFLFFTLIGSFGVYLLAKEFMPQSKSIWAGVIFTLMPYRLIEIQNGSQYAEFAGCSVIIFSFLFVTRICRKGSWLDVIGLAISYSILILTHLPLTVIGSLALFLYAITLIGRDKIISKLIKLSISVILGLTASSIYWLKIVSEMNWLHKVTDLQAVDFDYNFNFLLTSPWDDNRHYWFLNLILLTLFALVLSLMFSLYQNRHDKFNVVIRAVAVIFFFSILMTTVLSQPIWSVIPFLREVQFPSRWLAIASFSGSILIADGIGSILKLSARSANWKKIVQVWGGVLIVCHVLILSLVIIEFQLNHIPSQNFEAWMIEKSQVMGSDFFWTSKTKDEAFKIKEKVIVERKNLNIIDWQPLERVFSVEAGKETNARIATIFYPHWHATVNNQPTDLKVADDGSILVPLPAEKATVKIWFEEPFRIKTATYLSAATWLALLLIFLFLLTRKKFTVITSN